MRRFQGRTLLVYAIVALLIGWPVYQIVDSLTARSETRDAGKMLYQVSLFELELLANDLNEAPSVRGTEELNGLKQAAYSTAFAHERLAKVANDDRLSKLEGVDELLQFLMRLQLGGERPLKPAEADLLRSLQKPFAALYDAYGKLQSSNGVFIASQEEKVVKTDKAIAELIQTKGLQ